MRYPSGDVGGAFTLVFHLQKMGKSQITYKILLEIILFGIGC